MTNYLYVDMFDMQQFEKDFEDDVSETVDGKPPETCIDLKDWRLPIILASSSGINKNAHPFLGDIYD